MRQLGKRVARIAREAAKPASSDSKVLLTDEVIEQGQIEIGIT